MKTLIIGIVFLLFVSIGVNAQSTSQISGTILDSSGGAIADAQVMVTQTETGATRQTQTDHSGTYSLPNLPIGPYQLEVKSQGFDTYVQTGIVLSVNSNPSVNVSMQVGRVTQEVKVEADAIAVESTSTGVGQLINNQTVLEMPLNGRNVTDLVLLTPGTTPCNNCNGGFTGVRQYPVTGVQIGGGSPGGTYYSMDGSSHNDPGNNLNMAVPFPDALQEFKVETGAVAARYGQHANAVVTLATKSGTNNYHGDLFEFVRNSVFNAQNAFAPAKDPLKRNQFGGTFGGPVLPMLKNKLFFFGGYQRTIVKTVGTANGSGTYIQDFVPTAAMLQGDFTGYASAACNNGSAKTLTTPAGSPFTFAGNKINTAAFDKAAMSYLKYFPVSTDPCGKYQLAYQIPSTDDQILGRIDYQVSQNQSIFVRYFRAHFNQPYATALAPGQGLNAVSDFINNTSASLVGGHTYIFSPTLINTFHATFLDEPNDRTPAPYLSPTDAGSNMYSTPFAGPSTTLTVSPGFGLGGTAANNAVFNYRVYGFSDDVSKIAGSHQLGFGIQYLYQTEYTHSTQYSNGVFTFNGSRTGLSLSDFMLGLAAQDQQGGDVVVQDFKHYLGLYALDSWKVKPRLTLNYGLRWEPAFPISSSINNVSRFDATAFANNVKSTVYVNSPPGFSYPGDPGYPGQGLAPTSWKIFSPRFGFIFDPRGSGREAIRGAYGIFFDSQPLFDNIYAASNPPWGALTTLSNVSLSNPFNGVAGGNPFPFTLNSTITFPRAGTYHVQPQNIAQEYVQQWNLSFEKQLMRDWLLSISYVGNKSTHLWSAADVNAPVFGAGATTTNAQNRRPLNVLNPTWGPFVGPLIQADFGGTANYNGLILSANKAFTHGYSIIANYTFSHCINDFDPHQNTNNSNVDPHNVAATRGNCSGDVRQVFNLSSVLGSPKFDSRPLRIIAGDWQLSTIFNATSGSPFSILSGRDNAATLIGGQFADIVADPNIANPGRNKWFNTAAYVQNAAGTIGNSGRNSLIGPGYWNINLALIRNIPVKEGMSFQFRAEAYNVLNHTNLGQPVNTLTTSTFGQIVSSKDPRIMQLAMKFVF